MITEPRHGERLSQTLVKQGLVALSMVDRGLPASAFDEAVMEWDMQVGHLAVVGISGRFPHDSFHAHLCARAALLWGENGFQKIEPSHKLAASFMTTSMPPEVADHLQLPWGVFGVQVPSGLITIDTHFVLVVQLATGFMIVSSTSQGLAIGKYDTLAGFVRELELKESDKTEATPEADDLIARELILIGRLVLGVIAEMGIHRPAPRPSSSEVKDRLKINSPSSLKPRCFKLTRPVKLDTRDYIKEFISGSSSRLATVRTLVRGHWKKQPCGDQRTERKLIHIEPYWRGDEGLPIAVRSHIVDADVQQPHTKTEPTYVYFIQSGTGPIKIGISNDVERRLSSLQTGNAEPLALLASFYTTQATKLERELHSRFKDFRLEGEWFSNHPSIHEEIMQLRSRIS